MKNSQEFEVIIIGGSYAGLSAAMSLGRALRKVTF
jgi:thioredoxin reductase